MDLATDRLRSHGYRITRPRQLVLKVLAEAPGPMSPAAIHSRLAELPKAPDLVTIYRVLAVFEQLRIVHRTHNEDGYIGCKALDAENHHPILCVKCGAFRELDLEPLGELIRRVEVADWDVLGHYVEFTGLCPACRAAEAG